MPECKNRRQMGNSLHKAIKFITAVIAVIVTFIEVNLVHFKKKQNLKQSQLGKY